MYSTGPTIRELPPEARPRERLVAAGPDDLQDRELLAVLLRAGTRSRSALYLADDLLQRFGGLRALSRARVQELSALPGVGEAKAATLVAAFELGRRVQGPDPVSRPVVRSAQDAAALVAPRLAHREQEHFCVLLLNARHEV
ncbi:MAG: RadC family protein, partial [bacterium]